MIRLSNALLGIALSVASATTHDAQAQDEDAETPEIVFQMRGEGPLTDGVFRKELVASAADIRQRGGRAIDAADLAFEVEDLLLRLGYPNAQTTWTRDENESRILLTIHQQAGERVVIADVRVRGNAHFDDEALVDLLPLPRQGILQRGSRLFIQSGVDAWQDRVRTAYRSEGFLDVVVDAPRSDAGKSDHELKLTLKIQEGVRSYLRNVHFVESEVLGSDVLQQAVSPLVGTPCGPRIASKVRSALISLCRNEGYLDAVIDIEAVADTLPGAVELNATLREGPRVQVGRIVIQGNEQTSESFIRSRLALEEGALLRASDRATSFRRLFQSGLFDRAELTVDGEGSVRDLIVDVHERDSLEVFVAPGYGSYERLRVEAGLTERNLFGTGRRLTVDGAVSQVGESARMLFTDPWFLGSEFALDLPVEVSRREEPSFTTSQISTGLGLRRPLSEHVRASFGYELRRSVSRDVKSTFEGLDDDVRLGSLQLNLVHDSRTPLFNPTGGWRGHVAVEFGDDVLGGDFEFWRAEAATSFYIPLRDWLTAAVGIRSGVVIPRERGETIPIQERYFNGGEHNVRSFAESELGPELNGDPIGGEASSTLNVEVRVRVTEEVQAAAFYDLGNVVLEREDFLDDFRSGVGVGVRYLLPIGALRLDGAVNPTRRSGEDSFRIHFSVGMAF